MHFGSAQLHLSDDHCGGRTQLTTDLVQVDRVVAICCIDINHVHVQVSHAAASAVEATRSYLQTNAKDFHKHTHAHSLYLNCWPHTARILAQMRKS